MHARRKARGVTRDDTQQNPEAQPVSLGSRRSYHDLAEKAGSDARGRGCWEVQAAVKPEAGRQTGKQGGSFEGEMEGEVKVEGLKGGHWEVGNSSGGGGGSSRGLRCRRGGSGRKKPGQLDHGADAS